MNKIAIVGCGLVGSAWALIFARAGFTVAVYDPSPASIDAALEQVRTSALMLEHHGLLAGQSVEAIVARLTPTPDLADALRDADYVQESAPERLEIKRELYQRLGELASPQTILASSTSGLSPSSFSAEMPGRERVVVAHPVNPPHLVPVVEIIPAPWTSPEVVAATEALMKQVGQSPIKLTREIDGFIINRLQGAILAEAFKLIEDGICTVHDVDAAMADGLGLRWFFLGPFATIDLNAQGGVADYCAKLEPMYYGLAESQAEPRHWTPELVAKIEAQCRETVSADSLHARRQWRDECLAAFVKAKRDVLG